MVVAVVLVWMVQMTLDQVVGVLAMRDRLVAAAGAVRVLRLVPAAVVLRRAVRRIRVADLDRVLVHVIAMRVVQMPVVQIVDVPVVHDGGMAAIRTVLVIVTVVNVMLGIAHGPTVRDLQLTRQAVGDEKHSQHDRFDPIWGVVFCLLRAALIRFR